MAVNVIVSPSQKYPSGAFEVRDAIGGVFTDTVIDSVAELTVQPFSSVISIVITSPFAIAFAPADENVIVLLPTADCLISPFSLKIYVAVA